jgi:hypothetical protein
LEPAARAEALTDLAAYVPGRQRPFVLRDALRAATRISDDAARACALAELTGDLPLDVGAMLGVPADALAVILPRQPAEQRDLLADWTRGAATVRSKGYDRACVLAAVIPILSGEERCRAVDDALRAVAAERREIFRVGAIQRLAPLLSGDQVAGLLREHQPADLEHRAELIAALAPHLPPDEVITALRVARRLHNRTARAVALTSLIPVLPGARRAAVTSRALRAALAIHSEVDRAYRLAELVPHLEADDLSAVRRAAEAIELPLPRAQLLAAVAARSAPEDRSAVAAQARRAVALEASPLWRARVLGLLLPLLSAEDRPAALTEAVELAEAADAWDAEHDLVPALETLAPHLTASRLTRILATKVGTGRRRNDVVLQTDLSLGSGLVGPLLAALRHDGEPLTGPAGLELLRLLLRADNRAGCLNVLAGLAEPLRREAGPALTGALAAEVARVCVWWP